MPAWREVNELANESQVSLEATKAQLLMLESDIHNDTYHVVKILMADCRSTGLVYG